MALNGSTNNKKSDLSPVANKPVPQKEGESVSLNNFRETLKDVLEEITSLEVNTFIVGNIPMAKFDAKEFYLNLIESTMTRTEEGLNEIKDSLLQRSAQLKQKGLSLPQQTSTPLLPKEAAIIEDYRSELTRYNQDLEAYKEAERIFSVRKDSLDQSEKQQFELEQACYSQLSKQLLKLDLKKDADGEVIIDGQAIRNLRKLWEFEQSVLNGDRIYAQTKFALDGDLTNRFIDDLFMPSKSKIDPKMAQLIFDLHRQGVENAQKQWSGLINTCVNLVKELIPFRAK
ncbi:MAG: hypothetical protein DCF19_06475 [Pseudanabaena frigida]|uniref:Uncharacterized protein n=1 Tax=Pseudanabaena frigida TaxID=945775 RepID=A0A2W4YI01_9CYAN|nr:MAG: hypothetical protein DCF19_06475 [Pseudanabaena frigida]